VTARMLKQERGKAKTQWRQEQEDRKYIEARISEMEKQPGGLTINDLRSLDLSISKTPPATQFIVDRLNGLTLTTRS
jgi:hypothetical protein